MWVDDTSQMERTMKKAFPSLSFILEDATHGMRRYARTLPDGHVGSKAFMGDLSRAFFEVVESDREQLKNKLMEQERWGAAGTPMRAAAEKMVRSKCRHFIPAPKELRARVEKVVNDHASVLDPITGRVLFTYDTNNVHQSMLALIDAGKFSDPLPVDQMFLRLNSDKEDRFIGLRGTSSLEGFHCHLAKVLQGNRCSAELAGAMMADFVHAWNIERAITNIKGTIDYGCYDTMLLEEINDACKELKLPAQFPKLKSTPKLEKIPAMFTLAVPPELVPVLCPAAGGIAPLNGAAVEGDDACAAIDEFENQAPQLLLPIKNSAATTAAAPMPALGISPTAADVFFSKDPLMDIPWLQPLESHLIQRQAEGEAQPPVFSGTVLQQQQPLAQQEEQLVEVMDASPAAVNASPGGRSPSLQGKSGPGRPRKRKKKEMELPAATSPLAATSSPSPSKPARRSPRGKRNAMPADFCHSVQTPQEAALMTEVIGGDLASPELRSTKKLRQIARDFNAALLTRVNEDEQAVAGMSYKQGKHVKEFVQRSTQSLAVAATKQQVLSNQQQSSASVEVPSAVVPAQALQQSSSLTYGIDLSMAASQQPAVPVSQQFEAMQQQHQQQQIWHPPPPMQQLHLRPPQYAPYYNAAMHPGHPNHYSSYGMYPSVDPAALVQAAAALLQVQQQQQPLAVGKGGKGAPGRPRNCGKCGNPLKGKNKEEGACFCKSRAVQEAE
jgi:hypothetical protein